MIVEAITQKFEPNLGLNTYQVPNTTGTGTIASEDLNG